MKIGLTADLHLDKRLGHRVGLDGVNLRSRDLEAATREVVDGFIREKVEIAVFAGDLFDQFIEVHTLSHSFAQMMHACSMMFRGVFDRFPKLRIAFMEAGCSWAPYWFGRMSEEWELREIGRAHV